MVKKSYPWAHHQGAALDVWTSQPWDKFVNIGLAVTIILVVVLSLKAITGG